MPQFGGSGSRMTGKLPLDPSGFRWLFDTKGMADLEHAPVPRFLSLRCWTVDAHTGIETPLDVLLPPPFQLGGSCDDSVLCWNLPIQQLFHSVFLLSSSSVSRWPADTHLLAGMFTRLIFRTPVTQTSLCLFVFLYCVPPVENQPG